jgi:hypothetical protein
MGRDRSCTPHSTRRRGGGVLVSAARVTLTIKVQQACSVKGLEVPHWRQTIPHQQTRDAMSGYPRRRGQVRDCPGDLRPRGKSSSPFTRL